MADKQSTAKTEPVVSGLDLMREPFPANQISKLPKQAKWMTDKKDEYTNCTVCGGWHHPKAVHLDYVGHAALTDRLLECDPQWNWEPVAFGQDGAPFIDKNGGMWIRLTVCGVSRLGYGHPDGKTGGDATKEIIGDALRNAAMRFGAALDLWHKGDLHAIDESPPKLTPEQEKVKKLIEDIKDGINDCPTAQDVNFLINRNKEAISKLTEAQQKYVNDFAANRIAQLSQSMAAE